MLLYILYFLFSLIFFFNHTSTTEIYTLSLHDALPIYRLAHEDLLVGGAERGRVAGRDLLLAVPEDRKSTRLNSSHQIISYAVFCLKKKKIRYQRTIKQISPTLIHDNIISQHSFLLSYS